MAAFLPGGDGGTSPPARTLLATAALVTLVTTGALFLVLRLDLNLPTSIALTAVAYNALVVVLKLVLGPLGLYEENRLRDLDSMFSPDEPAKALLAAGIVFCLYFAAFAVLYAVVGGRLRVPRGRGQDAAFIAFLVLVGVLLIAVSGGAVLLLPLLVAGAGITYLEFVLSSTWSLLIGLAVAGAASLATLALHGTRRRAEVLGDATLFVTFFWIGVAFLALYHVLWVVYILVLTSIWPLRTVTPK